jgi:uncharacterized Zn finger protein (UPF0148 family)
MKENQVRGKEIKEMTDSHCDQHGHNYIQIQGKTGSIPTLACTKCGDVRQVVVKEKEAV